MKKWTKTAGLLFMAASSVYYGQAVVAAPGKSVGTASGDKSPTATDVRLLEELTPAANADQADPSTPPAPAPPTATSPTAAAATGAAPATAATKSRGRSDSQTA